MNYAILKPIYLRLKEDDRLDIFFVLRFLEKRSTRNRYQFLELRNEKVVSKRLAKLKKWDMQICADFGLRSKKIPLNVFLFHGISFRNPTIIKDICRFEKVFVVGNYMMKKIVSDGLIPAGDSRLALVGWPKVDALVNGLFHKDEILSGLRLRPDRRTVLYAPSHTTYSSLYTMGEEVIETVKKMGLNLIIKLHDLLYDPTRNPVNWQERLSIYEGEGVAIVRDHDVCPYLVASDILISDASSVANEFTLLDRPIVFLDCPDLIEAYGKTVDLETWGRKIGYTVKDSEQLTAALRRAIKMPQEHSSIRRQAAEDIFYKPGTATERAVREIYTLLDMEFAYGAHLARAMRGEEP